MKSKIVLLFLSLPFALTINAQQLLKTTEELKAQHQQRLRETEEQHRLVHAYLSTASFESLYADVQKAAAVSEADKAGFRKMISQKFATADRFAIIDKINRGELNKANIAGYFQKKVTEYASYYKGAYLVGKTSLLDPDPKIKRVNDQELATVLSQKVGSPVTLSSSCGNVDFELGNFTGWTGNYTTSNCTSPTPNTRNTVGIDYSGTPNTTTDNHGLCTPGNNDPSVVTATLPCVSPFNGGGYSLRLGDVLDGCSAADISFTFNVTPSNTNFTYSYACVLYDGHPASDAPKVQVSMFDVTTGQPIPCAAYSIDATQASNPSSGYLAADPNLAGLYYKPWSLVFVPLQAYVGDNVQVTIVTSDCNGGAHRGYGYFDFSCQPFQILTSSPAVCNGGSVTLTAPQGAATYSWANSAGGTTGITGSTSSYSTTVNQAGTYVVTMSSFGSSCTYTSSITVPGGPSAPIPNFTNTTACVGNAMQFTDQSNVNGGAPISTWHWDFGDAAATNDTSNVQNPAFTYTASGTYTVSLDINNGCTASYSATVSINPSPSVTVVSQGPFCPGDVVPAATFTPNPNDPNITYAWTNSNSTIGLAGSGSGTTPSFTCSANTTLANIQAVVTVTPTLNGCVGPPASYTITVKPTPIVNPGPDLDFCPNINTPAVNFTCIPGGGNPTFYWTNLNTAIGLGGSGSGSLPGFTTVNTTTNSVSATILVHASLNNCPGPDSVLVINIYPTPTAAFTYSRACLGSNTTLTDESYIGSGSITNWNWDLNNDGIFMDAVNQNPVYTWTPAGPHQVGLSVTSNKGCKNQVYETIYVNYPPTPAFIGDDLTGCPVHPVNFTESSTAPPPAQIVDWSWDFGNGQTSVSQQPTTVNFYNSSALFPVNYTVSLTVKTDSGCSATLVKNNYVMVYPQPIAGFSWDPTDADILDPTIHFYNASVGGSGNLPIKYYLGDVFIGQQDPRNWTNLTNPIHTYNDQNPYTYYVTQWVKNIYGCRDSVTHPIVINPAYTFYIPNAFSPNGDGRNEGFKGTGIGIDQTTYNIWVFDRWGNELFHAVDMEETWNGRYKGGLVQEDVYVWKVRFSDISGTKHEYHGTVSVVK